MFRLKYTLCTYMLDSTSCSHSRKKPPSPPQGLRACCSNPLRHVRAVADRQAIRVPCPSISAGCSTYMPPKHGDGNAPLSFQLWEVTPSSILLPRQISAGGTLNLITTILRQPHTDNAAYAQTGIVAKSRSLCLSSDQRDGVPCHSQTVLYITLVTGQPS